MMSFSTPIQWYHSHADPIWPDGTFKFIYIEGLKNFVSGDLHTSSRVPLHHLIKYGRGENGDVHLALLLSKGFFFC
jgi:hypothetical protein